MKKTITNPDGSTEVVEGTAEELAEYERKRKTESVSPPPTKKRRVLNEETVRAIAKEEAAKVAPVIVHHGICTCPVCCPFKPIWIAPLNPQPLPYVGDPLPASPPWYTITVTSDKVEIPNGIVPNTSGYLTIQSQN